MYNQRNCYTGNNISYTEVLKMNRIYNFSAGPSMLPLPVLEKAAADLVCYGESGM